MYGVAKLNHKGNHRTVRVLCWGLFAFYLLFLIYFAFISESFGRWGQDTDYRYNFTMFQEIRRFWDYRSVVGLEWAVINLLGNVICFMPFGFFVPVLKKRSADIFEMALYSFCGSLFIETLQLVLKIGVFDVDDLLLNTVGGVLGYVLYRCLKKVILKLCERAKKLRQ